ncbi:kinesin-14 [Trypoxylus dichotomus]
MEKFKSAIPKLKVEQRDIPGSIPPPKTQMNRVGLRRSKSNSDLKPLKDSLLNSSNRLPINRAMNSKVNEKSSSVTNLNAASSSKFTNTNPTALVSGKRAFPIIPEKLVGTKRAKPNAKIDTQKENEAKVLPKVTKPPKPAPYDYKARFNLLTEKHTSLQAANKGLKQELARFKSEFEVQEAKLKAIERVEAALKTKNEAMTTELSELQEKYNSTSKVLEFTELNLLNTKEKYCQVLKTLEVTEAISSERKTDLNSALDQLDVCKTQLHESETIRRDLNNTIQNLKGNIRVFCRVRPPLTSESEKSLCNINYIDEATLELKSRDGHKSEFMFDKVFPPEASQMELFEDMAGLVQSALDGYHVCVFAYGQTGSGKTYTMQGEQTESTSGMIPRSMDLLFATINKLQKVGWEYTVEASFLEIYNETIRDLLDIQPKQHEIRYNEGKGVTVTNLKIQPITSVEDFSQLMQTAWKYRAVAATNFNEHSSRSHAVTKVYIKAFNKDFKISYRGSLNLIDLAGSESAKTSADDRLRETKNINRSLSALGTVILALHNKENHVPFRNSKLTYLLQSCLAGNSKTLMVVNVSPLDECCNETMNSLRFAFKVKGVNISSRRNKAYVSAHE